MSELQDAANSALLNKPEDSEEVPRRRGRPKGSKNRPKDGSPPKTENESGASPWDFEYKRDESSINATAVMVRTAWGIASIMLPVRPLTDTEALELGEATDPVLQRWIPVFGQWKYELALVMCIYAMWDKTKITDAPKATPNPTPSGSTATVID